uniref:Peptidase A2 domain-containing protein n=1 Tax=Fibrocapsa japonica TaxID=94617 RepID=A0A7S2V1W7_9STRA
MEEDLEGMERIPIEILKLTLLPTVIITLNGVDIPALLDTGSPVTVLNSAAAKLAKLETVQPDAQPEAEGKKGGGFNPFAKIQDNFKATQVIAQAASRGDVLVIAGAQGGRVELWKTRELASLSLGEGLVEFPDFKAYVGDLPGLAALGGLGEDSPPAAVLGMDVLKRKNTMIYRQNEVFF